MINNRQAGRRNRGRNNNGRPSGGNRGGGDSGNRIDNRARGNATQLLEKYKNMARDAQMVGDRVNAEYFLQFADHYFRVLADNRARQEEQQPQQRFRRPDENLDYDGDDFDTSEYAGEEGRSEQPQGERSFEGERRREQPRDQPRDQQRDQRDDREHQNRRDRGRRERPVYANADDRSGQEAVAPETPAIENAPAPQVEAEAPRPRRGRPRKVDATQSGAEEGLDVAVLPPSIARADNDAETAEEAPRKRTRRARPAAEAAE